MVQPAQRAPTPAAAPRDGLARRLESVDGGRSFKAGSARDTDALVAAAAAQLQPLDEVEFPSSRRLCVFALLIATQMATNYDSGALAAIYGDKSPKGILAEFSLSPWEQGLLASLVYLGLTVGCIISGTLLQYRRPKHLLQFSLLANTGSAWAFALAPTVGLLLAARFCVGVSQAMLMVYSPVWVDDFAPPRYISTWMSVIQAGAPVGITIGYLASGFVIANTELGWSWCFYFQCMLLSPLVLAFFFIPHRHINARGHHAGAGGSSFTTLRDAAAPPEAQARPRPDGGAGGEGPAEFDEPLVPVANGAPERAQSRRRRGGARGAAAHHRRMLQKLRSRAEDAVQAEAFREVMCNGLVWSVVMTLSFLYFVVTGLQMWVTDYLTSEKGPIRANLNAVVAIFGACSVSAPIVGVLVGGQLLDRVGGYQGHLDRACAVGAGCGLCAVFCAFASLATSSFHWFIAWIWLLLFFGGGVVPPATGVLVAAVDKRLRGMVSSLGGLTYNLLGYFLGPFACGLVAQRWSLVWGFRVVMSSSALSAVFMVSAWFYARRRVRKIGLEALARAASQAPTPGAEAYELRAVEQGGPIAPASELVLRERALSDLLSFRREELVYTNVRSRGPTFAAARQDSSSAVGSHRDSESATSLPQGPHGGSFSAAVLTTFYLPRPEALSPDVSPWSDSASPASPADSVRGGEAGAGGAEPAAPPAGGPESTPQLAPRAGGSGSAPCSSPAADFVKC